MSEFWEKRRVLVTGATGLVGSWLVKSLVAHQAFVVAFVRNANPQSEFYRSDDYKRTVIVSGHLEDYYSLERSINQYEIDTVFHLGAQPIVNVAHRAPLQTFEANIRGTYNLLEACRQLRSLVKRVVIASSDKAYGEHLTLPYLETMPLQGGFPYEVSKSCADLIAQSYYQTYKLPVAIARCGNIYGGGDLNWSRVIPDTIRACHSNTPPIIRSDGTFVRDYIYVKDVVRAYMTLAEQLETSNVTGEAFNFSPGTAVSVLGLVECIERLMNATHLKPIIRNQVVGEIHSQYLDSAKAKALLGWKPAYTLEEGLQETIDWYRQYLSSTSFGVSIDEV